MPYRINIRTNIEAFSSGPSISFTLNLCIYLYRLFCVYMLRSGGGMIFFSARMCLLNDGFYGYSRSHKLYFEHTNTSCMTEQTFFFFSGNIIQFRQIIITAAFITFVLSLWYYSWLILTILLHCFFFFLTELCIVLPFWRLKKWFFIFLHCKKSLKQVYPTGRWITRRQLTNCYLKPVLKMNNCLIHNFNTSHRHRHSYV